MNCSLRRITAAFPRLVYSTYTRMLVCCASSQARNCNNVPTTGLTGKHSWWDTVAKCLPAHCERVPTTRILGHSTYRMMLLVHTHRSLVCFQSTNESWERKNKSRLERATNMATILTCVTFTDSLWKTDKCKCSGNRLFSCVVQRCLLADC